MQKEKINRGGMCDQNGNGVGLIKYYIDRTLLVLDADNHARVILELEQEVFPQSVPGYDTGYFVDLATLTFTCQGENYLIYPLSLKENTTNEIQNGLVIKYPKTLVMPNYQQALCDILFTKSNLLIWQYDIKKCRLYRSNEVVKETGYDNIIDNPADFFIGNGTIHPQTVVDYRRLFDEVHEGKDSMAIIKYRRHDGQYLWFQRHFYVIRDHNDEPTFAVGVGEPVDVFANLNNNQFREIISSDVLFYGEINFTLHEFIVNGKKLNKNKRYTYDQFLSYVMRYFEIRGQDRQSFLDFAAYDNIKNSYEQGLAYITKELQLTLSANEQHRWCLITIAGYHNKDDQPSVLFAIKDIDEKKKREIKLELHATLDALTQIYNRPSFELMVQESIENYEPGVLFVIDIDNFKLINDMFDHAFGDETLVNIASKIAAIIGPNNLAARLGGDEFAVWLSGSDEDQAKAVARKLLEQTYSNYENDHRQFSLSISIGGAIFPEHGHNFAELYNNAVKARYMAKESGKNQYTLFRPDIRNYRGIEYQTPEWILDMLDDVVYVCSLETCDLLYMNKRAREVTKVNDKNYKTMKCHKVICNLEERCPFCRYDVLTMDRFHKHTINPQVSKEPLVGKGKIVNWNGVLARLEIISAKEVNEHDVIKMKNQIDDNTRLKKLINNSKVAIARWTSIHSFAYCTENFGRYAISEVNFSDLINMNLICSEIHADDYSLYRHEIIKKIVDGVTETSANVRLKLKTGDYEWCRMDIKSKWLEGKLYEVVMTLYPVCAESHENENWQRQIEKYSNFDHLTGLLAYNYFVSQIEEIDFDDDYLYYILNGDINNFAYINDTYGYDFANRVLREFANHLESQIGERFDAKCTYLSRSTGDNFLAFSRIKRSEFVGNSTILDIVNNINNEFSELSKYRFDGYVVSFSMGIALFDGEEKNIRKTIDNSTLARKMSKEKSNFPVSIFAPAMRRSKDDEVKIEQNALKAFQDEEFVLYYQPKVATTTGEIVSCEALVRWQSKEFGFLPPNSFIPLFEKTGLIVELDYYVLMKACRRMKKFIDDGYEPCQVAINQSRHHFSNPNYIEEICNIVDRYQIPHHLIEFEITENVFLENSQSIVQKISMLQRLGFTVALDDFGSGFSSLNILNDLAVDVVKLDRALIREIETSDRSRVILENIIKMTKEMNSVVVNEGVETQSQVDFLKNTQCDIIQGYFYYRPIPEEAFYELYLNQLLKKHK